MIKLVRERGREGRHETVGSWAVTVQNPDPTLLRERDSRGTRSVFNPFHMSSIFWEESCASVFQKKRKILGIFLCNSTVNESH